MSETQSLSGEYRDRSNWLEAGGEYLAYHFSTFVAVLYFLIVINPIAELGVFDSTNDILGITLVLMVFSHLFAFSVLGFDRHQLVSKPITVFGKDVSEVILWLIAAAATGVGMGVLYLVFEEFNTSALETAVVVAVLSLILAVPAIAAVGALRRYWSSSLSLFSRKVGIAAVCLLVVLAGAVAVGVVGSDDEPGYNHTEPDHQDLSTYDNGKAGPYYSVELHDNMSIVEDSHSANYLTCSEDPGEVDINRDYTPAEVHTQSGRITLAPLQLTTADNESVTVDGHYYLRLENGSDSTRPEILTSGTYNINETGEESIASLPVRSDGVLWMENVDRMSVYYDVITEDGEVHRHTKRLCRSR